MLFCWWSGSYTWLQNKKGSWPLRSFSKGVKALPYIRQILEQNQTDKSANKTCLYLLTLLKMNWAGRYLTGSKQQESNSVIGILETSGSNRGKILKQKERTKPSQPNLLIRWEIHRKQVTPSNQTSFAEEMKSHLTEKWHKTRWTR